VRHFRRENLHEGEIVENQEGWVHGRDYFLREGNTYKRVKKKGKGASLASSQAGNLIPKKNKALLGASKIRKHPSSPQEGEGFTTQTKVPESVSTGKGWIAHRKEGGSKCRGEGGRTKEKHV